MDELCSCQTDMVAISVFSDNFPKVSRLSQQIKQELNVSIIFGGGYSIFVSEYILQFSSVDYVEDNDCIFYNLVIFKMIKSRGCENI
jgi:hypothetical protein